MSFFAKVGTLNLDTPPTGFRDVALGFTPSIVFFYVINDTGNTPTSNPGNELATGWAVPSGLSFMGNCIWYNPTIYGSTIQQPMFMTDKNSNLASEVTTTCTAIVNGFRMTTTKSLYGAYQYGYLALGGSDIEAISRNDSTGVPSVTGAQSISSIISNPNLAIINQVGISGTIPQLGLSFAHPMMAFVNSSKIFCASNASSKRLQVQDMIVNYNISASGYCKALFSSFGASSLNLNWTNIILGGNAQSAWDVLFMRLAAGFKFEIGEFQTPAVGGDLLMAFQDPLLNPTAVMFLSAAVPTEGETTLHNDVRICHGFVDASLNQYSASMYKNTAAATFAVAQRNDCVIQNIDKAVGGDIAEKVAVTGLFQGAMLLNTTGGSFQQSKIGYLAFGGGSLPPATTDQSYSQIIS